MKPVLSISKRTDLPAFYADTLVEWVRRGWAASINPFNRRRTRVSLAPEDVAGVVWWSRQFGPWLARRDILDRYERQVFQFTVTTPRVEYDWMDFRLPIDVAVQQATQLGGERVVWRCDPIVWLSDGTSVQRTLDLAAFDTLAARMADVGVRTVVVSKVDPYKRAKARLARVRPGWAFAEPTRHKEDAVLAAITTCANTRGLAVQACSEGGWEGRFGIRKAKCVNGERLVGSLKPAGDRSCAGRDSCGCTAAIDLGDYVETRCQLEKPCVYCYAR